MQDDPVVIRPEDIGARLRAVRELAGVSSRDLGRDAGLSGREITALERGTRRVTADELRAIAAALHVHPRVLVSGNPGRPTAGASEHAVERSAAEPSSSPTVDPTPRERRRDFTTRKQVEDSWSDLRIEMDDVIRQCMRVSTVGSGDDVPALLDALEQEIRRLRISRSFQRELARHERTITEARRNHRARESGLAGSRPG